MDFKCEKLRRSYHKKVPNIFLKIREESSKNRFHGYIYLFFREKKVVHEKNT